MSGGWNPITGRDTGGRPPYGPPGNPGFPGFPGSSSGHAYIPGSGPGYGWIIYNGVYYPNTRIVQPSPAPDPRMPAAQMSNSSGGFGCDPGYNYFFSSECTKAHIYYSQTPPWQLPVNAVMSFKATHIPCNTTLGELLKGFGCNNDVAKKNRCVEILPGGDGKWHKGVEFNGGQKDWMSKKMKDIGWDKKRSGNPGEGPPVSLWFCKE